jgi:hypothetical protein
VSARINPKDKIGIDTLRKMVLAVFKAGEIPPVAVRNINTSGIFYKLYLSEKEGNEITPEVLAKFFRTNYDENSRLKNITRKWAIDFEDWKVAFGYMERDDKMQRRVNVNDAND